MHRRGFLQTVSASTVAPSLMGSTSQAAEPRPDDDRQPQPKTFLFWDLWHLERIENLQHRQGEPTLNPQGTYVDPHMFGLNSWPTVYQDQQTGHWRMLYSALWKPFTLMMAESKDGIHWKPSPQPQINRRVGNWLPIICTRLRKAAREESIEIPLHKMVFPSKFSVGNMASRFVGEQWLTKITAGITSPGMKA